MLSTAHLGRRAGDAGNSALTSVYGLRPRRIALRFGGPRSSCFQTSGKGAAYLAAAAPPDSSTARQNPPLRTGAILYSSDGPNYAPSFPGGALVGSADGFGNNCIAHSLSQILSGDRAGAPDRCARRRCASVRGALVSKYGCFTQSELELHVCWHLIVEELGGRPSDRDVVCCYGGVPAARGPEGGASASYAKPGCHRTSPLSGLRGVKPRGASQNSDR